MCFHFPTLITIPTYHLTLFHPHINCVDEKNKKILWGNLILLLKT